MKICEAFQRVSPASFADKVGIPMGWFVISSRYMKPKSYRRLAHGKWFKISSDEGTAYRILRFSPNLRGSLDNEGAMVIDWVAWLDLSGRAENTPETLVLTISEVTFWQIPWMAVKHPDPSYRLAGWLALISLGLGVLSLVISLMPTCSK